MLLRLIHLVCLLSLLALFLAGFLHPITAYTQDLGRHLLLGKIIWETKQIPAINLLSYTHPDFPFLNHHYLSEVVYYLLKQATGDIGLQLFSLFLVGSSCLLIFFFTYKKTKAIIPLSFVAIVYLRILFERTDIRPEQFGYLFLAITITILYLFREEINPKNRHDGHGQHLLKRPLEILARSLPSRMTNKVFKLKLIYFLPFLTFLWIQLHISFIIGLFVIGLFLLDSIYVSWKTKAWTKTKVLGSIFLLSSFATIINPHGFTGVLYPFQIFGNYGYSIQENQTIFLLDQIAPSPTISYFKLAVILLFISLFARFKHTKPIDWLLAISFTFLAANAIRNFPLFAIATFIPLGIYFSQIYTLFLSLFKHQKLFLYLPLSLTCLLLLVSYFQIKSVSAEKVFGIGATKGAERGVDFFVENNLQGPVFNNFDIGSYLAYRLYPQEKVFIDGRPEAYPAEFIQEIYIPMQESPAQFAEIDKQYNFNTIFFSHTDQTPWGNIFLKEILQNKNWHVIYLDDTSLILVKASGQNKSLISTFGMDNSAIHHRNVDETDFQSLLKLASFYNKTGLIEQEIPVDQKILLLNPNYCPALYNLANHYTKKNDSFQATTYQTRFLTHCQ